MKNRIKQFSIALLLTLFMGLNLTVFAQGPPPPPGDHGATGNQAPANGAPIGTAVTLMLSLFGAYGAKKAWDSRKKLDE